MALFDKITKTATAVGRSAANIASNVGSNVTVAAQEQKELVELKSQVNVIEQELDSSYSMIGRKYYEYLAQSGEAPVINIMDILRLIEPKVIKKQELEAKIIDLEKEIKQKTVLREKQMVEEEFLMEKEKLDKALAMDLLDQSEYDAKLAMARKKVDNFEAVRRVEQQFEMGVITREEKDAKIAQLLG